MAKRPQVSPYHRRNPTLTQGDRDAGRITGGLLAILGAFLAGAALYSWAVEGNPGAVSDAAYFTVMGGLVVIGSLCVPVGVLCIIIANRR